MSSNTIRNRGKNREEEDHLELETLNTHPEEICSSNPANGISTSPPQEKVNNDNCDVNAAESNDVNVSISPPEKQVNNDIGDVEIAAEPTDSDISVLPPKEPANDDIIESPAEGLNSSTPPGRRNHVWNTITFNLVAFFVGYITLIITDGIHDWLQKQTNFYAESWDTNKTFQHIPEVKLLYLGDVVDGNIFIPENSNMVGISPGYWVALITIVNAVVGIVEYVLGRIRQPFVIVPQALFIAGWCVILITPLVCVNNTSAIIHRRYVNVSWWGYGWDRYRTGYCHMNETNPDDQEDPRKISMLDAKYILPVAIRDKNGTVISRNLRQCRWITDLHGLQILFSLYCCIIAFMHIRVSRYPAWGMGRCVRRQDLREFYSERKLR